MRPPAPMRRPLGERVVELLVSRGVVWLCGLAAGLVLLVVGFTLSVELAGILVVPVIFAATLVVRARDRVWILRRRIVIARDPISRRQFFAIMVAISIVAGLTSVIGWYLGSSVVGSYDERLRNRFRKKKKKEPAT